MNNAKCILAIDSNAHSLLWGEESNARGELLEDFMMQYGLALGNVGRIPTFAARGTETCIDITLTMNINVNEWTVSQKDLLSDHRLITFNLDEAPPAPKKVPDLSKADWTRFTDLTEDFDPAPPGNISPQWLDAEADSFVQLIRGAIHAVCPLVDPSQTKRDKRRLWSEELQRLKRHTRTLSLIHI